MNPLSIFKFVFVVGTLPILSSATLSFHSHLLSYPEYYHEMFFGGIIAFLCLYLFIYQFWGLYEFGHRLLRSFFSFVAPFDRMAASLIPFYSVITFAVYMSVRLLWNEPKADPYFIFFMGLSFAMHLLMTAQEMQEQEKSVLKIDYLAFFSFCMVFNLSLAVLVLDFMTGEWTFYAYWEAIRDGSVDLYMMGIDTLRRPLG